MTKRAKILIFFSLVLLILILYLVLTSESVKKIDNSNLSTLPASQPAKNKTTALSEENSKIKIKEIFTAYEKLAENNNFTTEKIAELKNKLFVLKGLPANFEKLSLNFVLALNRMDDYLNQKDQQGKNESQQIINQLKADYSWLSN